MIIDFADMKEERIPHFKGGMKETVAKMHVDNLNRIMLGRLEPGASIGMHTHDAGSEIVYVISGKGKALYDNSEERIEQGICHYCPKGHSHSLINDGTEDLVFFAAVPEQ